jgi:hypothetical protein
MSSKSGGRLTFGSCEATVIFTIVEIVSAARSVSRQPARTADGRRPEVALFPCWGFIAQAAANMSTATDSALK